jgi:hypothetical protein
MSFTGEPTWEGDWQTRINLKIKGKGYLDIRSFLKAHPGIPYTELARELGPDVAAVQLVRMQMRDAQENLALREAVMDSLVRCLRENLTDGWVQNKSQARDFQTALAYSNWAGFVKRQGELPELERTVSLIWDSLLELEPSIGWAPRSASDPLIEKAFQIGWPPDTPESFRH